MPPEYLRIFKNITFSGEDRLCGCSFIHTGRTLRAGLTLAKDFGFTHVDVAFGGGNAHYDAAEVAQHPSRFADEVRRESAALQLQVNECFVLNFGVPINTEDAATRTRTRQLFRGLCDFATRAQFRSVMLIAGPQHEGKSRTYSQELAASALRELVGISSEKGLLLNIEADSESCVSTPEEARDLCESVPGLGLTLDHSHFICQGIAPERIEILYPYTRHVHVRQSAPGQIVARLGEGVVDFRDVLQKLDAGGYRGLFCVEYLCLSPGNEAHREAEIQTIAMKQKMSELLGEDNL